MQLIYEAFLARENSKGGVKAEDIVKRKKYIYAGQPRAQNESRLKEFYWPSLNAHKFVCRETKITTRCGAREAKAKGKGKGKSQRCKTKCG